MNATKKTKKKLAVGHRVETRSKPRMQGRIIEALESKIWRVQMNDDSIQELTSKHLVNLEYKPETDMLSGFEIIDPNNQNTIFPNTTGFSSQLPPNFIQNLPPRPLTVSHETHQHDLMHQNSHGVAFISSVSNWPILPTGISNSIGHSETRNVSSNRESSFGGTINASMSTLPPMAPMETENTIQGSGYQNETRIDLSSQMQALIIAPTTLNEDDDINSDDLFDSEDDSADNDEEPHEDVDPQSIMDHELFEYNNRVHNYDEKWTKYMSKKKDLIDSNHVIHKTRRDKKGVLKNYYWRAVDNKRVPTRKEYPYVQLREFDFDTFDQKHFPYGELYLKLYPATDWKSNLAKLNKKIEENNELKLIKRLLVTEKEWWTFHALIMSPIHAGSSGMAIFFSAVTGLFPAPDFGKYMRINRFRFIKEHFQYAFSETFESVAQYEADNGRKLDPWFPVNLLIDEFNINRRDLVAASCLKTADELMSALRPRSSKTGGLPNISFVLRKPEPIGTEMKCVACGVSSCMLHLEIQKGKDAMRRAEHSSAYGVTSACSLRLHKATLQCGQSLLNPRKELFIADSWFAGVQTAEVIANAGHSFVGPVKTNSSGYPKAELAAIMKHWPAGSSICYEAEDEFGNKLGLTALGFKYRKKKSLLFVMTNDAGSTVPGTAYTTSLMENDGTRKTRSIERPAVLNSYFGCSNAIDRHNHLRQGELRYEKYWKTKNCWFRIVTTIVFGITATDSFLLAKNSLPHDHEVQDMTVKEFAALIARDLHYMPFNESLSIPKATAPSVETETQSLLSPAGPLSTNSTESCFSFGSNCSSIPINESTASGLMHSGYPHGAPVVPLSLTLSHLKGIQKDGKFKVPRPLRKTCCDPDCDYRSTIFCVLCNQSFCSDDVGVSNGRSCFYAHLCRDYIKKGAPAPFKKSFVTWQQQREPSLHKTLKANIFGRTYMNTSGS